MKSASVSESRGVALPIVLLLLSMTLVTMAAWLETSIAAGRASANMRDRVQAFHAADSALLRCVKLIGGPSARTAAGPEPAGWRSKASFEGAGASAIQPFAVWPYSVRVPQCLIEAWPGSGSAYLLTARGFGSGVETQAWLQMFIDTGDTSEGGAVRRWRRVVARPF